MKTLEDCKTLQDLKEFGITGIFPGTNPNATEAEVVAEVIRTYREFEEDMRNGKVEEMTWDDEV